MIGELTNVSVGGMLRLLSAYRQTGSLKVRGAEGEGEIFLEEGRLVGVSHAADTLEAEVLRLLLLRKGTFHFKPMPSIPAKSKLGRAEDVENLIIESSRHCDPAEAAEYLPPLETVLQLAPVNGDREKISLNLLRDEWNFLTYINGEDTISAIIEKNACKPDRARQIFYGLLSAGLVRKIRFRIPKVMEIATQELGDMGEALVRQAFRKLKMDQSRMHMRELINLLNELERSITLLLGPSRASQVIGLMWEGAKR